MSELEQQTKPLLSQLMQGHAAELDVERRMLLTQWIVLKSMLADANLPDDTALPSSARREFFRDFKVPNDLSISVGRTKGVSWATRFQRHAATLAIAPDAPLPTSGKNTQAMVWGVNQLLILVIIDGAGLGLEFNSRLHPRLKKLWPDAGTNLSWPIEPMLDVEAHRLSNAFEDFLRSKKVRWIDRSSS